MLTPPDSNSENSAELARKKDSYLLRPKSR